MAIHKDSIVDVDLTSGTIHRSFLNHSIGMNDSDGDFFGVRVFKSGVPVDLTNVSVQGHFNPPVGAPIFLNAGNYISGNVATVRLPQACYNYEGPFSLAIKLVTVNETVTVRIVDGMVDNTYVEGSVAPTGTVPTYQEVLAEYDQMVAATATANAAAQTAVNTANAAAQTAINTADTAAANCAAIVAAPYSNSATYAVGSYCTKDGKLYECTTAITTAEEWTAGHWTETKVGPEVSDLKSAIDNIIISKEIVLHKTDFATSYDSTYVNNGYISDTGAFSSSDSYRTYYLQAAEAFEIYLEPSSDNPYLSIAIYNSTGIAKANFIARYRNNDSNLPTRNNRLTIAQGQWMAVTIGYSSQADRDFNLGEGISEYTSNPTDEFETNVLKNLYAGKATKTSTALVVTLGKIKYEVNKYNNSTIRAYLWRTNACRVLDGNGVYQTVWADSDSDGVVKISGESDFIGGYHGDETETLFHLFVDGVEYNENSTFENKPFNEIVFYFESDVYHCNTSETPDVVAFKRNKIIKFNKDGYTVENYWTAQENLTCEISYCGMLSVENALINAYNTNKDYKYKALEDGGTNRSADITEVCFATPYGDLGISVENVYPNAHYGCVVSTYTGRMKVYASQFSSSAHGALSAGDVLRAKATIWIK